MIRRLTADDGLRWQRLLSPRFGGEAVDPTDWWLAVTRNPPCSSAGHRAHQAPVDVIHSEPSSPDNDSSSFLSGCGGIFQRAQIIVVA